MTDHALEVHTEVPAEVIAAWVAAGNIREVTEPDGRVVYEITDGKWLLGDS